MYKEAGIDQTLFKKWLMGYLPDYTHKINSNRDHETLVKNEKEKDINKVLLFTRKEKVTPVFKAVSAEFRNKLRFYVIAIPEKNPPQEKVEIQKLYGVEELPALVVERSVNPRKDGDILDEVEIISYKSKDFKLREIKKFLSRFARDDEKDELPNQMEAKK